jgi:hypothetical protein
MNDNIGKNYYNLIIDGKLLDPVLVTQGEKTYIIAEGLENAIHEIEIFKRTEQEFGKTTFYGFVVDSDATVGQPLTERTKLIEFIGNSITCGYGNEGKNGETFGPTTENHYMTFAAITSRNFNARHLAVCKSGIGIYRNYDGPSTGNTDCMTNYYTRTFLYDENPKYNFNQRPDLVCIDLGTNDFSTSGADSALFVNNYFRLIDTIQTKYTTPDILCLVGPMMSGSTLNKIKRYLTFIADSATKKGLGNVSFFEMSAQTGDLGIAIDYHPTIAQHQRNAQELTNFIKTLKEWTIEPLITKATLADTKQLILEFNTPLRDPSNNLSGFKVFGDNIELTTSNIYLDTTNSNILHIILQENVAVNTSININYLPGTVESTDGLPLKAINNFKATNSLTETKATKGAVKKDGASIILDINKNLKSDINLHDFNVTAGGVAIGIDSATTNAKQVTLYLNSKVLEGVDVLASYTGSIITAVDGILLSAFTDLEIKNQSVYTDIAMNELPSLNVYPNPSQSGIIYYHLGQQPNRDGARLEVFLANGTIVANQKITTADGQIDLSHISTKGVYLFKFSIGINEISTFVIRQ